MRGRFAADPFEDQEELTSLGPSEEHTHNQLSTSTIPSAPLHTQPDLFVPEIEVTAVRNSHSVILAYIVHMLTIS
jgi:hypothetical protein